MRFEPRHAFRDSARLGLEAAAGSPLPPQLAFLAGRLPPGLLRTAVTIAQRELICPLEALIANGLVSERFCYRAMAEHLGRPFETGWPEIEPVEDAGAVVDSGGVRLADPSSGAWLVAPRGPALLGMLGCPPSDLDGVVVTTPAHLAALVQRRAPRAVDRRAVASLPDAAPKLSAFRWSGRRIARLTFAIAGAVCVGVWLAPRVVADVFGLLFFAGMAFRLLISAAGLGVQADPAPPLREAALPTYTVLVPLKREADVVPELLESLSALDYPRAKLQVLLLLEPEDLATRGRLAALPLPPWLQVVVGPIGGRLRTKPRALNIGLALARGGLVTVFDAEDRPDPNQLRSAAARFAAEPGLACLQAALAIDRPAGCRLTRLFALEYASLYRLFSRGLARYGLPMPLGGTSNHFRTSVLRDAGGWDAWNVTEDADLGLRLARIGYRVEALASTTFESAPCELGVWWRQRRRWTKGWLQTGLVIASDFPAVVRQLGLGRAAALVLLLINLVISPLALPPASLLVLVGLVRSGLPETADAVAWSEATLAASVLLMGLAAGVWLAFAGRRWSPLHAGWADLALLPLYQLLIGLAAYAGLYDLMRRPFHWHKTPHGAVDARDAGELTGVLRSDGEDRQGARRRPRWYRPFRRGSLARARSERARAGAGCPP